MQNVLALDNQHEEDAQGDVANVGEHVVEVGEEEEGVGAQKVVVAEVEVSSGVGHIL